MRSDRYAVAAQRSDRDEAQRLADRLRLQQVDCAVRERNSRFAVVVRRSDLEAAQAALHLMDKVRSDVPEPNRATAIRGGLLESIGAAVAVVVVVVVVAVIGAFLWWIGGSTLTGLAGVGAVAGLALFFRPMRRDGAVRVARFDGVPGQHPESPARWWMPSRRPRGEAWRLRDWVMLAIVVAVLVAIVIDAG